MDEFQFQEIAQNIAAALQDIAKERSDENRLGSESGPIVINDIPVIVGNAIGRSRDTINCYPGHPSGNCHDFALFISLAGPSLVKKKIGHLTCRHAMEKIMQHMEGRCQGKTFEALFLTDNWDAAAAEEWRANLVNIGRKAHLEIYLMNGSNVSQITL